VQREAETTIENTAAGTTITTTVTEITAVATTVTTKEDRQHVYQI